MLLLFVVRSNACLGIDFVLFIFDIFVVSLGCLVLYKKHVRFGLICYFVVGFKIVFLGVYACTYLFMRTHIHAQKCRIRVLEILIVLLSSKSFV